MKTSHILLATLLAILSNGYTFSQQQQLGNSLTIGIEAYRPWTVSSTGIASNPVSLRFSQVIHPNWRIAIGVGWEQYEESGVDEISFSNQFEAGMGNTIIRSFDESTTVFDQAIGVQSGVRYLIPGGPDRLRLFAGVDALAAYYPDRRLVRNTSETVTDEAGQTIRFFESETVGVGYEGYGFGIQGNLGLELVVTDGLLVGIEFGPGTFARYRQVRHTYTSTGTRQNPLDPTLVLEFESENVGVEGEENVSSQRFRGMMYVGWEF